MKLGEDWLRDTVNWEIHLNTKADQRWLVYPIGLGSKSSDNYLENVYGEDLSKDNDKLVNVRVYSLNV